MDTNTVVYIVKLYSRVYGSATLTSNSVALLWMLLFAKGYQRGCSFHRVSIRDPKMPDSETTDWKYAKKIEIQQLQLFSMESTESGAVTIDIYE